MKFSKRLTALAVSAVLAILLLAPGSADESHAGAGEPPTNDNFADATEVALLPFAEEVDMAGATVEGGEYPAACSFFPVTILHTVWYRYTSPDDTVVVASARTEGRNMGLGVFTEQTTGLRQIGCDGYGFDGGERARVKFDAEAGTTYFFQIEISSTEDVPLTTFSLKAATAPPHDDFANALPISSLPFTETLNTAAATRETAEPPPCLDDRPSNRPGTTTWYTFTPEDDIVLVIDTAGTDLGVFVNVLTPADSGFDLITCTTRLDGNQPRIAFNVSGGQLYYLQVGGHGGSFGTLSFELSVGDPPINDTFADATDLSDGPFEAEIDTIAAGVEPNEPVPTCSRLGVGSSVWYRISVAESTVVVAEAFGDDMFPQFGVYQGASIGSLTQVECGPSYNRTALVGFEAFAGETYYLQVAGYERKPPAQATAGAGEIASVGDGGNLTIKITHRELAACPAPEVTVPDRADDVVPNISPSTLDRGRDIVSTGVSSTDNHVCLRVNFAERVESPDSDTEYALTGRVLFNVNSDTHGGSQWTTCRRAYMFGVDISVAMFGGFGVLAQITGEGIEFRTEFAVTTFAGQTMTLAIPREYLDGGESFRYAVWAVTPSLTLGGGEDCAPDRRYINLPPLPHGDATCDTLVNAVDAAVVLQFSAGLARYVDCHYVADANRDGTVSSIDAALILQLNAGLLDVL